jgi:glycosyltransferase involved in cell wall biosynthesis
MPALTVAMPVNNAMPYLPQAVESILNQSFADFEFIIADDGSDDGSADYLRSLSDPRVHCYHGPRRGLLASRNMLLGLTRTAISALMDADDIAHPQRLRQQFDFMARNPEVVLLGSQIDFLAGERLFTRAAFPTQHSDILRALLRTSPVICHPSSMFRMDAVQSAGGYRLAHGEDIDLFLRLAEHGKLGNLRDRLHTYRIHLGSTYATRYSDHKTHISYAIRCYHCREAGRPEPAIADFLAAWQKRFPFRKLARRIDAWSALEFRRALVALGTNHRRMGFIRMIAAMMCRPLPVAEQLRSRATEVLARSFAASAGSPRSSQRL